MITTRAPDGANNENNNEIVIMIMIIIIAELRGADVPSSTSHFQCLSHPMGDI